MNPSTLISAAYDNQLKYWDLNSKQCTKSIKFTHKFTKIEKMNESEFCTGHIYLYDIQIWKVRQDLPY